MLSSMTAFARQEDQGEWGHLIWEIRSVNHRFLDLSFKLPESLRGLELQLRELSRTYLHRGKVDCLLRYEAGSISNTHIQLNDVLVKQLITAANKIAALTNNQAMPIDCVEIMSWPGVIQSSEGDSEKLQEVVLTLFEKSLKDLLKARQREGEVLRNIILQRLKDIEQKISQCEQYMPMIVDAQKTRILNRFKEIQLELEPNRLEQEMVIFMQKIDISEEIDRLKAHVKEIHRLSQGNEPVGRRLDFLMQEMNREANTLGAKSVATETSHISVDIKVFIEQMREQIQNIE